MSQSVVIVNTGCANISSVRFALERLGVSVTVSDDTSTILKADKVLFPGVGAAGAAMASIEAKRLVSTLRQLTQPILGICLGMQLMVTASDESRSGPVSCLNLIEGNVERLDAGELRLPHMGWNTVSPVHQNSLFANIPQGTYFYFVHSFAIPQGPQTLATCEYGQVFSAAIESNNYFGVQFHPERSGEAGAQLLLNFINL